MKEIQIVIENLKKIDYLEFIIKIEKGIYAIIGNNGTGKSSLITCISGVFALMSPIFNLNSCANRFRLFFSI